MPHWGHPSSTTTARLVLATDAVIVASSSGRSERRSTTSAEIPSCSASCSAALRATVTVFEWQIRVTSCPVRLTSARPIGTTYSPSGTSPLVLYNISPSSTITGLSSRIAALRRPLASAGGAGAPALRAGVLLGPPSHGRGRCGPRWGAAPLGPPDTHGRA